MKTSPAGRAAITKREGNKLKAYKDSIGVWTCGVGHTSAAGPPEVKAGMTITAAESDAILSRDLALFEKAVDKAVTVPMTQAQFDALVSLAFNIGGGAFAKSTLVKKLNAGDVNGAANAFLSWDKAGGKRLPGLTTRRKAERAQFLSGVTKHPYIEAADTAAQKTSLFAVPATRLDTVLKRGSSGAQVGTLQRDLNELGYGPLMVDERFGEDTEKAVVAFQVEHGLNPDGWAGRETNKAIGSTIKDRETAPVLAAATQVVDAAASEGRGISKTEIAAGVVAVSGAASTADEVKNAIDSARSLSETLWSLGPWILVGLLIIAGAAFIYNERRKKRVEAQAVQKVL